MHVLSLFLSDLSCSPNLALTVMNARMTTERVQARSYASRRASPKKADSLCLTTPLLQ